MNALNQLEPDDFPWDLRLVMGYQCQTCLAIYQAPRVCHQTLCRAMFNQIEE